MRKHVSILLPVLLVIGLVLGCGEDVAKPQITRLSASETCGVAPLRVDFRGDATGGAPLADPTGTNNWLKFTWDFGDGTVIENGTSIAYHEYAAPGTYLATLTAEDDGGDRASRSLMVDVRADSLVVEAYSEVAGVLTSDVKTCEPVTFAITADACDFDPVRDSYERYVYRWTAGGVTYRDPSPVLTFSDADVGPQAVTLVLEDPVRSITRYDT
ncbi:MAG: PKD domain-containing protein [Candidatus Krumholzibacteriia bacterium]